MVIIGNCGGNDYGTSDSGPHAVLTADDVDYTYDDVGNMVTAVDASANTTTYSYDDLYHLTGVDFPAGDDLSMVYDADGTRVSRTEGDTTITYVGGLFEVEDDGTTTLRTHYTFGGDHIAVRVDDGTTDTLTYLFGDHLGSVAVTYEAGTAGTTSRYFHYYYPYGEPRGTQTEYPSDHTYTGQIDDPGGLMYYRARHYQPSIGRFTQADTIIPNPYNSQSYDRYMYVRGNPVLFADPTGHRITDDVNKGQFDFSYNDGIASESDAKKLATLLGSDPDIPFCFLNNGCFVRAEMMANTLRDLGVRFEKVGITDPGDGGAGLHVDVDGDGETDIDWFWHITVGIMVDAGTEEPAILGIDPPMSSGPVTTAEWAEAIDGPVAAVEHLPPDTYALVGPDAFGRYRWETTGEVGERRLEELEETFVGRCR